MHDQTWQPLRPFQKASRAVCGHTVFDTGVLFLLGTPLSPPFIESSTSDPLKNSLWGALKPLHQAGQDNIVPEMVSYETAQVLSDGKSTNAYFDTPNRFPLTCPLSYLFAASLQQGFIRIVPPPENDTSSPTHYLNQIWRVHTAKQKACEKSRRLRKINKHWKEKIRGIEKKHDLGDFAARSLISSLKDDAPIFYVSEDFGALWKAHKHCGSEKLHIMTFLNFLNAIQEEGLLAKAGIHTDDLNTLTEQLLTTMKDMGTNHQYLDPNHPTYRRSENAFRATLKQSQSVSAAQRPMRQVAALSNGE